MSEQKYLKYFVFDDKKDLKLPSYRLNTDSKKIARMTHIDAETVEGATFYNEMMWILPGFGENYTGDNPNFKEEHTHEFGELMCFYGLNYDDIMDLGAEIEFTVDGETYTITESFTAFIPPGVKHGPLTIRNVTRPIAHMIACDTGVYK
ncbi:MAG: hypothetical protein PVG39_32085 [Desulfobacteraceae bacterium]|jgi:hypothetical protein